jgi:hypothetical protein
MTDQTMPQKELTTSWLWRAGEGVNGLKINADKHLLEWYDDLGCACGDSSMTQSYDEYFQRGPAFSSLPDDVKEEVDQSLATLTQS